MYIIDKTFEFCYGHRVWTQKLDANYANDLKCACRHLHGHEGKVQVFLEAEELKDGMVTDFRHLEWLKKWLNDHIDHKFVMDKNDPLLDVLFPRDPEVNEIPLYLSAGSNLKLAGAWYDYTGTDSVKKELYEGLLVVNFVPTSENFAFWLAELVSFKMRPLGVKVRKVEWWETPKSRSCFEYPSY